MSYIPEKGNLPAGAVVEIGRRIGGALFGGDKVSAFDKIFNSPQYQATPEGRFDPRNINTLDIDPVDVTTSPPLILMAAAGGGESVMTEAEKQARRIWGMVRDKIDDQAALRKIRERVGRIWNSIPPGVRSKMGFALRTIAGSAALNALIAAGYYWIMTGEDAPLEIEIKKGREALEEIDVRTLPKRRPAPAPSVGGRKPIDPRIITAAILGGVGLISALGSKKSGARAAPVTTVPPPRAPTPGAVILGGGAASGIPFGIFPQTPTTTSFAQAQATSPLVDALLENDRYCDEKANPRPRRLCREGFIKEYRDRDKTITWRVVDCETRKQIKARGKLAAITREI